MLEGDRLWSMKEPEHAGCGLHVLRGALDPGQEIGQACD
jgi:hypothetical protein